MQICARLCTQILNDRVPYFMWWQMEFRLRRCQGAPSITTDDEPQ